MKRTRVFGYLYGVATVALLSACGGGDMGGDASDVVTTDTVHADVPRTDVQQDGTLDVGADTASDGAPNEAGREGGIDASPDSLLGDASQDTGLEANADVAQDAAPPAICMAPALINLNTAGTTAGGVTTYTGSNTTATQAPELPPPSCAQDVGAEVAFTYTATTRSHLYVSTDNTGTSAMFDTVVWVLDGCTATATETGCNDDDPNSTTSTTTSALTTSAAVNAGATVYIIVAGYTTSMPATGTFQLTVTEIPEVAAGGMCDLTGVANACAAGSSCIQVGTTNPATCIADGDLNGLCKPDGSCNAGFACDPSGNTCLAAVAIGGTCDPNGTTNVCVTGSSCVTDAASNSTCVADGALGAACHPDGSCDVGLACSIASTCLPSVAIGGACDPAIQTNACVMGSSCVTDAGGNSTCVADGAQGGRCLTGGTCNAGLVCEGRFTRHCVTEVPVGGMCDLSGQTNGCTAGSSCVSIGGANATCVADGAMGGQCPASGTCNSGLSCSPLNTCLTTVAVGASCDPNFVNNTCIAASSCVGTGASATCVADGGAGAACEPGDQCQAGLVCDAGTQICFRMVADGGACDGSGSTTLCTSPTSTCVAVGAAFQCIPDGTNNGACLSSTPECTGSLTCTTDGFCKNVVALGGACDPTGVSNACAAGTCHTVGSTSTCTLRYTETAIATPTFIDACTGGQTLTFINGDRDDGYSATAITVPFTFQLFGTGYTALWPSANGVIAFGPDEPVNLGTGGPGSIPDNSQPPVIAPFWDDLIVRAAGFICTKTLGTGTNQQFVVEWVEAYANGHTSVHLTFEAVLYQTTNVVDLLYSRLDPPNGAAAGFANGSNATIGMQGAGATESILHTGNVTITAGIRFTPGF